MITDRSHLKMAKNLIPGDLFSVFKAFGYDEQQIPDEATARTYGLLVDANNVHGGFLQKFLLPLSDFESMDVELSSFFKAANNSEVGVVLEVVLDYSDALHNMQKDFPVAPREKMSLQYVARLSDGSIGSHAFHNMQKDFPVASQKEKKNHNMLSQYKMGLLDQAGNRRVTTLKLVQRLCAKKKYTVHYITLNYAWILISKLPKYIGSIS